MLSPYAAADEALRERLRRFATDELPRFVAREHDEATPRALVEALGKAGFLKLVVPKPWGAAVRVSSLQLAVAREELSYALPLADTLFAMQGLGSYPVTLAGDARLKKRHLAAVATGASIAAFALTEKNAGSDAAALETTARRDGRYYVLDGEKRFISNAGIADVYTVFAKTDPGAGARGITAFVVEADTKGFEVSERTATIAAHPLGSLRFERCRVPASARLGSEGEGLKLALRTLEVFRPTVGAAACGMGGRALDESVEHLTQRRQFGRALKDFQALRFKVAEMATDLDGARLLVERAARLADLGKPGMRETAMAKLAATEAAWRIVDQAVQIHGGQGLVTGSPIERLYREVRALRIYEGTSEIQKLVIARAILGKDSA